MSEENEPRIVQEEDRISPRRALVLTAVAVTVILLTLVVVGLLLQSSLNELYVRVQAERVGGNAPERRIGTVLQTLILTDRYGIRLQEKQRQELTTYRWVDKAAGTITIPIDEAMRLEVERARP